MPWLFPWRAKQLEYTFRRAAMGTQQYQNFNECTHAALVYADAVLHTALSPQQHQALLTAYTQLPAFADVVQCLTQLNQQGHSLWAFSNGTYTDIAALMAHAGVMQYLEGIYSADPLKTFKPDPAVYHGFAELHTLELANHQSLGQNCVLVSSNPFDIIGAQAANWQTVWLQRHAANVFDSWELQPKHTIRQLSDLNTLALL